MYKFKTRSDGSIVSEGFIHEYDSDYEETFFSAARLSFIRTLNVVIVSFQLDIFGWMWSIFFLDDYILKESIWSLL